MSEPSDERVEERQCWVFCLDYDDCPFGWGPTLEDAYASVERLVNLYGDDPTGQAWLFRQAQRVEAFDGYSSRADIPARVLLANDYGVDCSICKNETFSVDEQVYWTLDGQPVCDSCNYPGAPHVTLEVLDQFHAGHVRAQRAEQDRDDIAESYATVLLHITNGALSMPSTDPQVAIAMSDDLDTERWNEETTALEERAERAERDNERLRLALLNLLSHPNWLSIGGTDNVAEVRLSAELFNEYMTFTAAADERETPATEPPKAIIRPDDDGQPDDFVIEDVSLFRMEQMDKGSWWIAVYRGDKRLSLFLNSKKRITCVISEDDLGCVDDREGGVA